MLNFIVILNVIKRDVSFVICMVFDYFNIKIFYVLKYC